MTLPGCSSPTPHEHVVGRGDLGRIPTGLARRAGPAARAPRRPAAGRTRSRGSSRPASRPVSASAAPLVHPEPDRDPVLRLGLDDGVLDAVEPALELALRLRPGRPGDRDLLGDGVDPVTVRRHRQPERPELVVDESAAETEDQPAVRAADRASRPSSRARPGSGTGPRARGSARRSASSTAATVVSSVHGSYVASRRSGGRTPRRSRSRAPRQARLRDRVDTGARRHRDAQPDRSGPRGPSVDALQRYHRDRPAGLLR